MNAHPHQSGDGRFTLVHNGVIENYLEIKETYLAGMDTKGSTDSEIVVQLIALLAKEQDFSGKEAFRQALKMIEGSYAVALLDAETPDILYAAKNKSPLLIDLGDHFNVVVSDAMASL